MLNRRSTDVKDALKDDLVLTIALDGGGGVCARCDDGVTFPLPLVLAAFPPSDDVIDNRWAGTCTADDLRSAGTPNAIAPLSFSLS